MTCLIQLRWYGSKVKHVDSGMGCTLAELANFLYNRLLMCTIGWWVRYCRLCDQVGRFCNQSSPKKIGDFWAHLKKINLCKNWCGYYLGNFLTSTSGHTVGVNVRIVKRKNLGKMIRIICTIFYSNKITSNFDLFWWAQSGVQKLVEHEAASASSPSLKKFEHKFFLIFHFGGPLHSAKVRFPSSSLLIVATLKKAAFKTRFRAWTRKRSLNEATGNR